jgi:hypothetical protein
MRQQSPAERARVTLIWLARAEPRATPSHELFPTRVPENNYNIGFPNPIALRLYC